MTSPLDMKSPPAARSESVASVDQVLTAFRRLRAATADLLNEVGADPMQTRETARRLGLNRGLAWRMTRVVRSPESPLAVSDVPGRQSVRKFVDACRGLGASDQNLRSTLDAFDAYETAVNSCSGDRRTLSMLMLNREHAGPSGGIERARRQLFEGAAAVWGVQAQTRFVTVFVFPSPLDSSRLDAGHVTGFVGLRRLIERPWPLSYEAVHDSQGQARPYTKTPLDPTGSTEGELQLLKSFCWPPTPKIEVSQMGSMKRFELAAGPVGNEGMTTCVFGSYLSKLYPRYSPTPDTAGFMVLLQTPIERVIFDMFVHRDIELRDLPQTQLLDRLTYSEIADERAFGQQALPIAEVPHGLQTDDGGAMTVHIPWYPRLLSFVTQRIGLPLAQFAGSRFEMSYPPIATTLSRRFELAKPPV